VNTLAEIRLGTSSFTAQGWDGAFYPKGTKSADRLSVYAEHFDTVEIDSTFYASPSPKTVDGWAMKTPDGFIFSVKVPQVITHDKVLIDCDIEFEQFVETMGWLGEKLSPILLQFPFFDRASFKTRNEFLDRLIPFLRRLPRGFKFAVEIRNKEWLDSQFARRATRLRCRTGAAGPITNAAPERPVAGIRSDYHGLDVHPLARR